jgi:hypothetical protein
MEGYKRVFPKMKKSGTIENRMDNKVEIKDVFLT